MERLQQLLDDAIGRAGATRFLLAGSSGRLGSELTKLYPAFTGPSSSELDITASSLAERVSAHQPDVIVHAAAYTNVSAAETERARCWAVNVDGTMNLVRIAGERNIPFVFISTDYVFDGKRGQYKEDDVIGQPMNYYAFTKIVGEQIVRTLPRHLILRTSFRPREWPYETAFTDVVTSQDYVDVIAPEVLLAILKWDEISGTLHVAGERKTVYDLAKRRKPDVRPASKREVAVTLPDDISLDCGKWQSLKSRWIQDRS